MTLSDGSAVQRRGSNAMISRPKTLPPSLAVFAFVLSSTLPAQNVDTALRNWTVPPYRVSSSDGGLSTMVDIPPGVAFVAVQPCRIVDTRDSAFPPGYGTPSLTQGLPRNFDLNNGPCTGIPAVAAYSLNLTVTNTQGLGFLIVYPQGGSQPNVSTLNYVIADTVANAAIVPAGTGGGVTVVVGVSGADLIIDINGYFTQNYNPGVQFTATSSISGQGAIFGTNSSSLATSSGVYGLASATTGAVFGVLGKSSSTSSDSAGVKGTDGTGTLTGATSFGPAGVRGESLNAYGTLGLSRFVGVRGDVLNATGATLAEGRLGYAVSGTNYGAYAIGDIGATGTKSFVLPHPSDPSLVIRFISLEGPEAGTYFRGRGRLEGRSAVIEVPESFRLVTEPDGLSIQLTSVGRPGTLWVSDLNLDQIVVQGARDVEFFYTVNGIRRDYAGFEAIAHSSEFVPESAGSRLSESLPATARQNLVTNGAYHPDGSVNLQTAHRLRWNEIWQGAKRASTD
jgi:hypothetical protein